LTIGALRPGAKQARAARRSICPHAAGPPAPVTEPSRARGVDPDRQGLVTKPAITLWARCAVLAQLVALQPDPAFLKRQGKISAQNRIYASG
jgi:hypothetical protein